ncbi:hypothetical protein ACWEN6_06415 [Sphaerisporangium sp. NPDC004334]
MNDPYPINAQSRLLPVEKRSRFGFGTRRRPISEIPMPLPHQVVVLSDGSRFDGSDRKPLGSREHHVINATSYSVIDITRERPVAVRVCVPSSGADEFTLEVTFACTVTDPATVAKSGHRDLTIPLQTYLKSYHRLHQIGLRQSTAEVADVKDNAIIELGIYAEAKPPIFAGMHVQIASVEVLTPEDVREERRAAERRRREHEKQQEELDQRHELTVRRRNHEKYEEWDELQYTYRRAEQERRFSRELDREDEEYRQDKEHSRSAALLDDVKMYRDALSDDRDIELLSMVAGRMNEGDFVLRRDRELEHRRAEDADVRRENAERDRILEERRWEERQERLRAEHAERMRAQELESERIRQEREEQRERLRGDLVRDERDREERKETRQLEYDKEIRARELKASRRRQEREDRREDLQLQQQREMKNEESRADLARELVKRGHLDQTPLGEFVVEQLVEQSTGVNSERAAYAPAQELAGEERSKIPPPASTEESVPPPRPEDVGEFDG